MNSYEGFLWKCYLSLFFHPKSVGFFNSKLGWVVGMNQTIDCSLTCFEKISQWWYCSQQLLFVQTLKLGNENLFNYPHSVISTSHI